ncbi:MAG TPA: RHS repeat-associated core domain-containing protein, partial [Blastocatellia bacterium]|nr:RHS repeat-associated core domain-containing protein [Blastocatellia bacterium]
QSASYNDGALSASSNVTYDDGGVSKTISSTTNADGWGRAIQFIAGNGAQVNTSYDAMGRVTSRTNPFPSGGTPGPSTSFQYDALGRQTVTTLPDGNTVQNTYSGTAVTVTDQVNRKIKRETDGLGRLTKVTEQDATGALAQDTNYTYDLLDRLTGVNQGGQTRAWKYDGLGRLLFERIPEQSATINDGTGTMWSSKYTYTSFNTVDTKTDARGVITTYGYDTLNRLTSISYNTSGASGVASTPGVSYIYDNVDTSPTTGLLLSVQIGGGASAGGSEENYGYDALNRASSVTQKIWVSAGVIRTYTTSYQYNQGSQATQMTYPSGLVLNLSHDNKGRVTSVGSYLTSVSYDNIGRVSGMNLGNGVVESYWYDANRMQLSSQAATKGATTLMNLTYSYQASAGQMGAGSTAGNAGQLMSVIGSIGGTTESAAYTYDNLGRLVTSSQTTNGVSAQRRFDYDRWGNRTGMWDAVSGGNQIQSVALPQSGGAPTNQIASVTTNGTWTVNYVYDAAGNVTNDGVHTYSYDSENRLVSVDGGATASYAYDHQNRRYKKTVGSTVTHYVWEGYQVVAEHNGSTGTVLVDYVYSGSRMISKIASGSSQYFLNDRLSVRLTMDGSGTVIGRQAHCPFGEDFAESGTQEKHHFTSYERDSESGVDNAINRGYSAGVGRFVSIDRVLGNVTRPQRLNRYAYTTNDPIGRTDPLGLDECPKDLPPCGEGQVRDAGTCECVPIPTRPPESVTVPGGPDNPFEDPFFRSSPIGPNGFIDVRDLFPTSAPAMPTPSIKGWTQKDCTTAVDNMLSEGDLAVESMRNIADGLADMFPDDFLELMLLIQAFVTAPSGPVDYQKTKAVFRRMGRNIRRHGIQNGVSMAEFQNMAAEGLQHLGSLANALFAIDRNCKGKLTGAQVSKVKGTLDLMNGPLAFYGSFFKALRGQIGVRV